MILEQAFQILPEALCGSRYPGQEYESGIVSAFAMSVLQQLNGRNAPNPIGCFEGERLYDDNGFGQGRWLRADLVVATDRLRVANQVLGNHYQWRHRNWLEAKFSRVRGQAPVTSKTPSTALLIADLIRLIVLVPETPGEETRNGRYLLHVYDRPADAYLSFRRNNNSNGPSGTRRWVRSVVEPGRTSLTASEFNLESPSFKRYLGDLGDLKVDAAITTQAIEPVAVPHPGAPRLYWCYLTRVDAATVTLGGHSFSIGEDRTVSESAAGDLGWVRSEVASKLGQLAENETEPPEDPLPPDDELDEAMQAEDQPE